VPQELIFQDGEDHSGNGQDDDDNIHLSANKRQLRGISSKMEQV
jgi:hypothetical protein